MKTSISKSVLQSVVNELSTANAQFTAIYPGDRTERQPVHSVYGGANLFKFDTVSKIAATAQKVFASYADSSQMLTQALDWELDAEMAETVFQKVKAKLETEAVEDFRIDFEDGYGNRPDTEEDTTAEFAALEVAKGMAQGTLSPFIGIRIKPFTEELKNRGIRTLDIFLTTLSSQTGGKLPKNFVVTLPKVQISEQVAALVQLFENIEANTAIESGALRMEIMVETTQSIIDSTGVNPLLQMVRAGKGRITGAHFGTYDYTAGSGITARLQAMDHQVCDFAHHMMKVALGGTGIWLSDGATNVMPVGPHRGELSPDQLEANKKIVHAAWKLQYDHINHSLSKGIYQGWDLHPGQLPIRYATVYAFFLVGYEQAAIRLKNFIDNVSQATLSGDVFDDAATGQGLLNYFLKAVNCGAIGAQEVLATGLTMEEIQLRSFAKIVDKRLC